MLKLFVKKLRCSQPNFSFSTQTQMNERIAQRVTIVQEFVSAPNNEVFKAKLNSEQIAFVDLLYESIFKNSSVAEIQIFQQYVLSKGLETMPAEEVLFDTLGTTTQDFDVTVDLVDKFYTNNQKMSVVYSEMQSINQASGNSQTDKANQSKTEPVAQIEPEKPKVR